MSNGNQIDLEKLTPLQRREIEQLNLREDIIFSGINNSTMIEPVPVFDAAACENVINGDNNSWIILGRDRPADITSGYGGLGNTGAASVDIVVGRMASAQGGPDSNIIVAPNFFTDAARIHISQKTDIDRNFGLVGDVQSVGRSAVGLKADAVRVIGREGIKLVTGKAKNLQGPGRGGEKNSLGEPIEIVAGIELIAGNDLRADGLEPIAKANVLSECLLSIVERISDLSDIVNEMAKTQTQINTAIATHTHTFAGPGAVLIPPDLAVQVAVKEASKVSSVHTSLYSHKMKLSTGVTETYLRPTGAKWIGSRFNKTN
jgi:hypothetical protein